MSAQPPKRPAASRKKAVKSTAPRTPVAEAPSGIGLEKDMIRKVQLALSNHEFYHGEIDGIWGLETEQAMRKFQHASRLAETGEPDDETLQLLLVTKDNVQAPPATGPTDAANNKAAAVAENPSYWLLKLSSLWDLNQLQPGAQCYFHTNRGDDIRPEYKGTLDKIQPGDLIIGFDMVRQEHTHTFIVDRGIHEDASLGEIISFHVHEVLPNPVPATSFATNRQQYDRLVRDNGVRFFPGEQALIVAVLKEGGSQKGLDIIDPKTGTTETIYLPGYFTEGNHRQTEDKLGFEHDYQSLATVMAMKSVSPPLAIGLFGNWGSGKSFFMEKLHSEVEKFSQLKNAAFVENVVQVRFNSWHYADTNLWASLVSEIFQELHKYAKIDNKEDELTRLQQSLNLAMGQKEAAAANQKELEERVARLEGQKAERRKRLEDLSGIGLIKLALSDKHVAKDLQKLKNKQVEKILEDVNVIENTLKKANSFRFKLAASWKLLQQAKGWRWVMLLLLVVAVVAASVLAAGIGKKIVYEQFLPLAGLFTSGGAAFVKYLRSYWKPAVKIIKEGTDRLNSLLQTAHARPDEINPELNAQREELNLLKGEIEGLDKKINATRQHIDEIASGARLASFLEQRTADENYSKQLGLISLIRKDFGRLDELLRMQFATKEGQQVHNPLDVQLKIDRIILYIDDLDRCNADTVVKVLEAIHLLLAFPLFVVVVGVDPRWLNNALNEKYAVLFGGRQGAENNGSNGFAANAYDYLEKIFQIPFCLKPINNEGREKLIAYLVKNEMAQQEKTPHEINGAVVSGKVPAGTIKEQSTGQSGDTGAANRAMTERKDPSIPATGDSPEIVTAAQVRLLTDRISFSADELCLMQKLSAVYATSPRTINRFVNIYRIIKSHRSLSTTGPFSNDDYGPLLVVLSVVVGFSGQAQDFIAKLKKAPAHQSFVDFLKTGDLDLQLEQSVNNCLSEELRNLACSHFQNNMDLISRFSFRTLL